MTFDTQNVRTESEDCRQNGGCSDTRMERIYRYLDGALNAPDLAEVREHIENCSSCQSEHDLELIIRDVVKRSCEEKAPHSLKMKIVQRLAVLKVEDE